MRKNETKIVIHSKGQVMHKVIPLVIHRPPQTIIRISTDPTITTNKILSNRKRLDSVLG